MSIANIAQHPDVELAEQRLEITAKFFRGLTDLTRLRILEILMEEGEKNVSELVEELDLAQGRVSSHLACLRWCGFVTSRREGKYVYYSVADERIPQLIVLARSVMMENALSILTCTRM